MNFPERFEAKKALDSKKKGETVCYTGNLDCTGCGVCVEACNDDAIKMVPIEEVREQYIENWDFCMGLGLKKNPLDKFSKKRSQYE